jgi:transposase
MERKLTPAERVALLLLHKKERDGRVRDRIKAVIAYDDGYTYSEIARILLLDDETIRRHIDAYHSEKKLSTGNGGSDGKLTDSESRELIEHLQEITYLYVKDICEYVKRLNFIGGICLNGHRFIYQQVDTVNASTISDFLLKLRQANPGNLKIHVIWDNARYHRNVEVEEIAKRLCIKLHFLPPYSPNLNPIERMWKLMHESVRYNKYYGKFSEFTQSTLEFFKGIGRKKCILRNRITDNFQILHSPLFAS